MKAAQIDALIEQVRSRRLPRRTFIERLTACGLSVPMAGFLLLHAGVAQSQPAPFRPTRRGGGGPLRLLEWQGPTQLNPHFATGLKDYTGCCVFYEPLVQWDADGHVVPVLAAALPSRANGGLSADGKSVVWTLKQDVRWHDGQPFTADDVIFNWQYATNPATAAVTSASYAQVTMERVDTHTVRVVFDKPSPFWPGQYSQVLLLPRHRFAAYAGAHSREAPDNNRPIGTGAYRFVEFRPGDLLRATLNPAYHQPMRPYFDTLEMKGGGDATTAARAVLQTGEYDFASALVVDDEVLARMEAGGRGRVQFLAGGATTSIYLNFCDPGRDVDGERSHASTRHPLFSDPAVRRAVGLLVDRAGLQRHVYGRQGQATANFLNHPARYRSAANAVSFDPNRAAALLDAAGWRPGGDGVRSKDGRRLQVVFQSSINSAGQKLQAVFKQAARQAGIQVEVKTVPASVFFSSDTGNPDTAGQFNADLQSYSVTSPSPDPAALMRGFTSAEVARKANKWQGQNRVRWQDPEYDAWFNASEIELDPVRRAALFIRMNDRLVADGYVVPVVDRARVCALRKDLVAPLSAWGIDTATLPHWHRV